MPFRTFPIIGLLGILGLATRVSSGADTVQPDLDRRPIATYISEAGTLLRREDPKKPWELVADRKRLHSGDILLSAGDAALASDNGAVRLLLGGDIGGTTQLPILETAVKLHAAADVDLDFTFLRGRVELVNRKAKGVASVRVRGPERAVEIRLLEPGTRVALVAYGRWLAGVPFHNDAKIEEHRPELVFAALVLHGEIDLRTATHQFVMRAPPGPALVEGDEIGNTDATPRWLDTLPHWAADQADSEDVQKAKAALAHFRDQARQQSMPEALDQLLLSDNGMERKIAVILLGATDDIQRLANLLATAQSRDLWENAVLVSRHWIGREPGQDQRLYRALVAQKRLTPIQAETVLQLLHNFSDDELTQPETYEALIDLLGSDQLAIRGLAYWHLYRLVPAGRKIGFDPLASTEKRAQTVQEWRKLVPAGKLPPSKPS
jgi:hypothetical protein